MALPKKKPAIKKPAPPVKATKGTPKASAWSSNFQNAGM
jgi:hypothetical protein